MINKEKLLKELAGLTLFEAIKWLLLLVGGWVFSVTGAKILSSLHALQFLAAYKWHITAIFAIGTTWVVFSWFQRFNRHRPIFPKLDSDFHILQKEITFTYTSPAHIIYKRNFKLKALKNNLDRFNDRYCWTGSQKPKSMYCSNKDQIIDLSKVKDVYQFFDVILERTFNKGENVEVEIIWELDDSNHEAGPFISATIYEPTDKLIMSVDLADCLGVTSVVLEHSPDTGAKKHFETKTKELINRKHTWPVATPMLLHLYRIRWQPHHIQ